MLVVCMGLLAFWLRSFTVSNEFLIESWGGEDSYHICSSDHAIQLVHRISSTAIPVRQQIIAYVPFPVLILPIVAVATWCL